MAIVLPPPERLHYGRPAAAGLAIAAMLAISAASCADLRLRQYRDDACVANYRYALGESYVAVDGLKFCYQEAGAGETVLILPGLGTSIDYWQYVIPALASRYHVVAVDLPGFGKSDKPDAGYELSWLADKVFAFMDARGIGRASVIGGSMGGHLALLMALNHPERVSKLVLMGSVGNWEPPGLLLDTAIKTLWNDGLATTFLRERWPELYSKMFKTQTPMTEAIFHYDMALRADGPKYYPYGRAASRAFRSILKSSCRDRLGEINAPVLLVWGEEDAIHSAAEVALHFRQHLPDSRLVVVSDAAHEVMVDQPAAFNKLALAFLGSGTAGVQDRLPPSIAQKAVAAVP
ncbi:MAG: alpha/beta fold hydrolase [Planctomycetota bacterium]|nr:alpha/beta fold hydrolase [Planctomycetota bacterium]